MTYKDLKKQATDDLGNYYCLKASINSISYQLRLLKKADLYHGVNLQQSVMSSHSADSAVISHISQIEQLESRLKHNRSKVRLIDKALNALFEEERTLLLGFYIYNKPIEDLSLDASVDRSWLYRKAERALKKYILAYFGTIGE